MTFICDCTGKTTRQINRELRQAIAAGHRELRVLHPDARHNLAVALLQPVRIVFEGSVGYYCAGCIHQNAAACRPARGSPAARIRPDDASMVSILGTQMGGRTTVTRWPRAFSSASVSSPTSA